jgi:hypothetical protein
MDIFNVNNIFMEKMTGRGFLSPGRNLARAKFLKITSFFNI